MGPITRQNTAGLFTRENSFIPFEYDTPSGLGPQSQPTPVEVGLEKSALLYGVSLKEVNPGLGSLQAVRASSDPFFGVGAATRGAWLSSRRTATDL